MRRRAPILAGLFLVLFLVGESSAAQPELGFAFGRMAGNIKPYTVRIENDGAVQVHGPAIVGRKQLNAAQIGRLNLKAVEVGFARMPPQRDCIKALPDVAYTFIRVGPRTVKVRGTCVPGYTQLWNALTRAVKLQLAS